MNVAYAHLRTCNLCETSSECQQSRRSHLDANTKIAAEIQINSQQKHLLKMINIYKYKHNT